MNIKILGSGCPTCELLYNRVKKLKEEGKINAKIEYIKDVKELIERGITASPALLVNEKPIFVGLPADDQELLDLIEKNS